jgi:hypothetical protein
MSLREIQVFIKEHSKKKILDQIQLISSAATAAQGDKKSIDKTLDTLQKALAEIK